MQAPEMVASQIVPGTPLVADLKEFIQHTYDEDFPREDKLPLGLRLGIQKMRRGRREKFYRLIWMGRGQACLAAENTTEYQTKSPALAAGYELAASLGAIFNPSTR